MDPTIFHRNVRKIPETIAQISQKKNRTIASWVDRTKAFPWKIETVLCTQRRKMLLALDRTELSRMAGTRKKWVVGGNRVFRAIFEYAIRKIKTAWSSQKRQRIQTDT